MKQETPLQLLQKELMICRAYASYADKQAAFQLALDFLNQFIETEREILAKAFEDGVGEGMTDPERPLTGEEYVTMKFKKQL